MLRCCRVYHVRVLVLTQLPGGGPVASALERLGLKPYTFRNTFQRGNASSHPPEWVAVLEGRKHFSPQVLRDQFDCLVGPPAAIAFDRVLKGCPAFTKVILVEEHDKEQWARDVEQHIPSLIAATERTGRRSVGKHLHTMVSMMFPNDKKLGRAAALEIFEERAKRTIPEERLLVYRLGDGWEPICEFLEVPIPKDIVFPAGEDNFEVMGHLEDRLRRAERVTWYATAIGVAITVVMFWPFLGSIMGTIKEYYTDYRIAFTNETDTLKQEGREADLSLRKAMIMSKNVTMEFEKKFQQGITGEGKDAPKSA